MSGLNGTDLLTDFEVLVFDDVQVYLGGNAAPFARLRSPSETEAGAAVTFEVDLYDTEGEEVSVVSVTSGRGTVSAVEDLAADVVLSVGSSGGLEITFDRGSDFDYVAAGEVAVEPDTLVIVDAPSNPVTKTFEITVTGTNSSVEIDPALGFGIVVEDKTDPVLSESGTIAFTDTDRCDTHSVSTSFTGTTHTSQLGTLSAAVTDPATGDGAGAVA